MSPHRSASYLWELTVRRLFPKRGSRRESRSRTPDLSQADDFADGFYKYSQELLEQERLEDLRLRSSDTTTVSYVSALMEHTDLPELPYTVSSPDWNIFSPYVKALDELNDKSTSEWLNSVVLVWSRVYTVSKVVLMAFMHYGVDLDDSPDGILAHVRRAEKLIKSKSITDFIDNTENMYYALYARLIMEIANADLCASFSLEYRRVATKNTFILPEPAQMCRILRVCKNVLADPALCANLNTQLIKQHQDGFISRSVNKVKGMGFVLDDLIGYRPFALSTAHNKFSGFCQKWCRASMMYQMPPEELLAIQSEKYLVYIPKMAVQQAVPALNLPFIDPHTVDPDVWEHEIILDNRQATLAKLEGKCVGDLRHENDRRRLVDFVRERKCICRGTCSCAWDCTQDVERHCPCSERLMTLMIVERRTSVGPLPFGSQCNVLAKACFQGIASIHPDAHIMELSDELNRAFVIFGEEIQRRRVLW